MQIIKQLALRLHMNGCDICKIWFVCIKIFHDLNRHTFDFFLCLAVNTPITNIFMMEAVAWKAKARNTGLSTLNADIFGTQ